MNVQNIIHLQNELEPDFEKLLSVNIDIKQKLENYADGKLLKGDEIVGWLGEVYGKILLGGKLVDDQNEHDFVVEEDNKRIAVKARKGIKNWETSSVIHKIEGPDCPTHLMFIKIEQNYTLEKAWLYKWSDLLEQKRFKVKKSRDSSIGWIFRVRAVKDKR